MRIVAVEEHFCLPEISRRIDKKTISKRGFLNEGAFMQKTQQLLTEVGPERVEAMDEAGITTQVLSLAGPGAELLPEAESIMFAMDYNDALSAIIDSNPDRFAGFAHLPMVDPNAAAKELERAVNKLGFSGALINGTTNDLFLDDTSFEPLLAAAEELKVPLYLHPSFPPALVQNTYYGRLAPAISAALASAAYGWHAEVAIHILRLQASGTLDKFPELQLIIGHMGETLPFMMARAEAVLSRDATRVQRTLTETLKAQVSITTSGMFTLPPLMCAIDTFGIERILFAVDYPYSNNLQATTWLDTLPLPIGQIEAIAYKNAERLIPLRQSL